MPNIAQPRCTARLGPNLPLSPFFPPSNSQQTSDMSSPGCEKHSGIISFLVYHLCKNTLLSPSLNQRTISRTPFNFSALSRSFCFHPITKRHLTASYCPSLCMSLSSRPRLRPRPRPGFQNVSKSHYICIRHIYTGALVRQPKLRPNEPQNGFVLAF